jgi:hypothetical protein
MKPIRLAAISLLVSFSATAQAQPVEGSRQLGGKGNIAISIERLFGFSYSRDNPDGNGQTQTATTISLLSNPLAGATSGYTFPRLAIDGFVTDSISVGGAVGFFSTSVSPGNGDLSGFLLAPRVGYAMGLTPSITFWPRAGVTYVSADFGATTSSQLALTLEAPFVFGLTDHFGLSASALLDLGIAGSNETTVGPLTMSVDHTVTDIGIQVGAVGFF